MKEVYLHIGLHKTGTTFLQLNIFPGLKNIKYISVLNHMNNTSEYKEELIRVFKKTVPNNKMAEKDIEDAKKLVEKCFTEEKNLTSYEIFSHQETRLNIEYKKDRIKILQDLQKIFEGYKIKIILGLRRQDRIINSEYCDYIVWGGTGKFQEFLAERDEKTYYDIYRYSKYIDKIYEIFGENEVFIYRYEDFIENKTDVLSKLMEFIGEKEIPEYTEKVVNRGYGKVQVDIAKKLNPFFKSNINPKGIIPCVGKTRNRPTISRILQTKLSSMIWPQKHRLPKEVMDKIKHEYAQDNKRLLEKYGIAYDFSDN